MRVFENFYLKSKDKRGLIYNLHKSYDVYILLVPSIVLLFIFSYLPMYGVIIAFKDYNVFDGFAGSPWVGFKHFKEFINNYYFYRLLRNTVLLGSLSLLFGFWPPIIFALLLNEIKKPKFKKTTQSISYLPAFISLVVVVGMIFRILAHDGVVNHILSLLGSEKTQFFHDPKYFRPIYILSGIWQGMGTGSIIYLAALAGIDTQLYEASFIDGASRFQRVIYITIPGILPTITILFILNTTSIISVGFEKVFLLYNPAIYETADVIATFVYRRGIAGGRFSSAAAIGLFNSVIAFLILLTSNLVARRFSDYSLW